MLQMSCCVFLHYISCYVVLCSFLFFMLHCAVLCCVRHFLLLSHLIINKSIKNLREKQIESPKVKKTGGYTKGKTDRWTE